MGEISNELQSCLDALAHKARDEFGETEFKYYAIPIRWRNGAHSTPLTGLERYEVTEAEWIEHREESRKHRTDAFMGKLKQSYTAYERRPGIHGWKTKLIELVKEMSETQQNTQGRT